MNRYYTLVGSRETPENSCRDLTVLANLLARIGWIGRSGGADGADSCLEDGCLGMFSARMEIYLPWWNFNGRSADNRSYIDTPKLKNYKQAELIASTTHPAWDKIKRDGSPVLSRGAKALHTRNVYQVLGKDLNSPSTFLLCWAEPTPDGVKGGTNTAVQLAKKHGADIINLYGLEYEDVLLKLISLGYIKGG